jgi:hypothetical protein
LNQEWESLQNSFWTTLSIKAVWDLFLCPIENLIGLSLLDREKDNQQGIPRMAGLNEREEGFATAGNRKAILKG